MSASARSVLLGIIVMLAVAVSLALGRGPQHQLRDKPFQDTHEDLATMASMSEQLEALNKPRVVQTESIRPIERDPLMMALAEPAVVPPPRRKPAVVSGDICAKHGLRKIITDNGRSWRCQR